MPFKVPFFMSILELKCLPPFFFCFLPLVAEPKMLSICMVPAGMVSPPHSLGSVSLLVSLKASAL